GRLAGPQGSATGVPDQAEVANELAANPSYVDDDVSESAAQTSIDAATPSASGSASVEAAVPPLTFWRTIRSVERTFEFAFADPDTTGRPTRAIVTVRKHMTGSFNILVSDQVPEGNPPQSHVIHKPLVDNGVRRILLRRVRLTDDRSAWRVV